MITAPIPMPMNGMDAFIKGYGFNDRAQANRYSNLLHPSGDVANALYVEQMKRQYGENDPRYIEAKRAHEMGLSARQSLMDYRGTLNQTAGIRATSPLGKLIAEGKGEGAIDILRGNQGRQAARMPSNAPPGARYKVSEQYYNDAGEPVYDNNPRTPDERKAYEQAIAKGTTDAAIRNKIPYAKNVKITMDSIQPESLVQYSGPQGTIKHAMDSFKAAAGSPPPEFMEYQNAVAGAKTLSKQLRQFWGDSIQPAAMDKIDQLTNPSHWTKNPQVALAQFNQLKKITDQELETFQQAGTSPIKLGYDKKSGNFVAVQGESKPAALSEENRLLQSYTPELLKMNPNWTAENIKHTAKLRGMSVGQLIDQLMIKGR